MLYNYRNCMILVAFGIVKIHNLFGIIHKKCRFAEGASCKKPGSVVYYFHPPRFVTDLVADKNYMGTRTVVEYTAAAVHGHMLWSCA